MAYDKSGGHSVGSYRFYTLKIYKILQRDSPSNSILFFKFLNVFVLLKECAAVTQISVFQMMITPFFTVNYLVDIFLKTLMHLIQNLKE